MALSRALCLLLLTGPAALPAQARADAGWQWPVRGPLLEAFHTGRDPFAAGQHRGIDIVAPEGSPVVSACPGRVRFAGPAGTAGLTISVGCGGLVATYLHLRAIAVREGQAVAAGRRLGSVGASGRPRSPVAHLHFGVRVAARRWSYVDPLSVLGEARPAPGPLLPPVRPPPGGGLGRVPRPPVPRPVPSAVRAPRAAVPVAVRGGPSWAVWAGLGLIALGVPAGALAGRRRRRSAGRAPGKELAVHMLEAGRARTPG